LKGDPADGWGSVPRRRRRRRPVPDDPDQLEGIEGDALDDSDEESA
jgi:hypothetical protein